MSLKFDQYQLDAINSLNNNVIVSASAGAGKTAVLINRLMKRMLEDQIEIDEICALTFTDAAASEMKNRLLQALNEALDSDIPLEKKDFITRQIPLVETAHITTIHSFCLNIIKDYGYIINLEPTRANNILDEGIVQKYQEEALEKSIYSWITNHDTEAFQLFSSLVRNPINLNPLKLSIKSIANYLQSKPNREAAINQIIQYYSATSFDDFDEVFKSNFFTMYQTHLEIILESLHEFLDAEQRILQVARDHNSFSDDKFKKNYDKHHTNHNYKKTIIDKIEHLIDQITQEDINFYENLLETLDFKMLVIPKTFFQIDKELIDPILFDTYTQSSKNLQNNVDNMLKVYIPQEEIFDILHQQKPLIESLIEIAELYLYNFNLSKERANGFDFDDFENYALEILKANDGYVSNLLKEKYKEIMIDEFQDTNEFQDSIVRMISKGDNIFRVGDIKQSIYRFRGAEPSIMQSILDDNNYAKAIYFKQNFRSKFSIVEFNNLLYEEIMKFNHYSKFHQEDVVLAGNASAFNNSYPVEILFGKLEHEERVLSKERNQIQAKMIANRIIELHKDNQYQFKDITILVRSHNLKIPLKEAFEEAQIPHHIDDRSGFFTSKVVSQVIAWLNFIIEPNDYYLVDVLLSPFLGFDVDQIATLSMNNESLIDALKDQYPESYKLLMESRKQWMYLPVSEILVNLYNINNTYHEKLSLQVKTNLDFLLEKAISYEKSNTPSLNGFISYIDGIEDDNNEESTPIEDDENVVRVATIHQSKGLQYPVTFLWLTKSHNVQDFKEDVLIDNDLGVLLNHLHQPYNERKKNIVRHVAEFKQRNEDLEEYIRLLYVATTRAEERLILVDVDQELPSNKPISKSLMYNFKSSLDLIYPISTQMDTIMKKNKNKHSQLKSKDTFPKIIKHNFINIDEDYALNKLEYKKVDLIDLYNNRYRYSYEFSQPEDPMKFDFNPNFFEATSYGTQLHEAIEHLPHRLWSWNDLTSFTPPIQKALKEYNQNTFTQKLYEFEVIEHELPFIYLEHDQPKQGIIDFIAINKDEVIVVDFKSDNVSESELRLRYAHQLQTYKKALEKLYPGLNITTFIYSFRHRTYFELK